jgi:hypothetical protein
MTYITFMQSVPKRCIHKVSIPYYVYTSFWDTLYNKQCWLVGDYYMLLRDFGPYVKIFMNVHVVVTVAMVR